MFLQKFISQKFALKLVKLSFVITSLYAAMTSFFILSSSVNLSRLPDWLFKFSNRIDPIYFYLFFLFLLITQFLISVYQLIKTGNRFWVLVLVFSLIMLGVHFIYDYLIYTLGALLYILLGTYTLFLRKNDQL